MVILAALLLFATDPISREWHTVDADKRLHIGIEAGIAAPVSAMMFLAQAPDEHPAQSDEWIRNWNPIRGEYWTRRPTWTKTTAGHLAIAAGMSLMFGIGKEVADETGYRTGWPVPHPGQGADPRDLASDVVGTAAGCFVGMATGDLLRYSWRF